MAITVLNNSSQKLQNELIGVLSSGDIISVGDIRKIYAEQIASSPFLNLDRAKEIMNNDVSKPIFKDYNFHPDELPQRKIMSEIATDTFIELSSIDAYIMETTDKYTKLIIDTISRLDNIKQRLNISKKRIEDINFLNSSYKNLTTSIPIISDNMSGGFCFTQDTFSAFANTYRQSNIQILLINGNGYSGNNYVLDENDDFLINTDNRDNSTFLTDNNPTTIYEYSRLCNQSTSLLNITDVNNDNKDVTCTIILKATTEKINILKINSSVYNENIKITDLFISQDGINYTRTFNGITNFKDGYVILSFPETQFVKIFISSSYADINEKIGYNYVDISDTSNLKIKQLQNVIRKIIPLTNIEGYAASYTKSIMVSDNLAPSDGCSNVCIFSNEYIPDGETETNNIIEYELIINNEAYAVRPINGLKSGIKLITNSQDQYMSDNVVFINEKIRTIQLRVTINPIAVTQTPFINNLKVFIG